MGCNGGRSPWTHSDVSLPSQCWPGPGQVRHEALLWRQSPASRPAIPEEVSRSGGHRYRCYCYDALLGYWAKLKSAWGKPVCHVLGFLLLNWLVIGWITSWQDGRGRFLATWSKNTWPQLLTTPPPTSTNSEQTYGFEALVFELFLKVPPNVSAVIHII